MQLPILLLVEFKYGVDNGYETRTNTNDLRDTAYARCQPLVLHQVQR